MFRFLTFLLFSSPLLADTLTVDPPQLWPTECVPCGPYECPHDFSSMEESVIIDLRNPSFQDGVLTTHEGGVLTAPGLRIQARHIVYVKNDAQTYVYCAGDLMLNYHNRTLTGDSLTYDFNTHSGCLTNGHTGDPPWYVSGKRVLLCPNGDLLVENGVITTAEGGENDVAIATKTIKLTGERRLTASGVTFRLLDIPFFWFPKLSLDMKNRGHSPLGFTFGWGGFLGSHVGVRYNFFDWKEFKAFARADAFVGHGLGIGLETVYDPKDRCTEAYTRNYYAHDLAIDDPQKRDRYRYQGTYYDKFGTTTASLLYDFVSDGQFAADFQTQDFELNTAGRTQLDIRRQEPGWIANLFTRVRVNDFQSVNQELPTLALTWHPYELFGGIVMEHDFRASYLDYVFSDDVTGTDFSAARVEIQPRISRPFHHPLFTATPHAGLIGIAYSESPTGSSIAQAIGDFGVNVETAFSKCAPTFKHVVEPYAHYRFLTQPLAPVDRPYIFTIRDGYNRLSLIRLGVRNALFTRCNRPVWLDLWANAFFDTTTIPVTIPKGYSDLEWRPTGRLLIGNRSAWNFDEGQLDYTNTRIEWTATQNFAISLEYRHRGRYDWRKADFYNFILETARTENALLASPLSDRRDTFLLDFFVRLSPDWNLRLNYRKGWDRLNQPPYTEFLVNIGTVLFQHWRTNFQYEKREADNRYSFTFKLDPGRPSRRKYCPR